MQDKTMFMRHIRQHLIFFHIHVGNSHTTTVLLTVHHTRIKYA